VDRCVPGSAPVAAVCSFSVSILMLFGSLGRCWCGVVLQSTSTSFTLRWDIVTWCFGSRGYEG